jgi:putative intracellular protease/amidase
MIMLGLISLTSASVILAIVAWNYFSVPRINGAKVLVSVASGFDEKEYFDVVQALRDQGATVLTAGFEKKEFYGDHGGGSVIPELEFTEVNVSKFDAVFIPRGKSPENILYDSRCKILLNLVKKATMKA